jgi:hypothetical protein
MFSKLFNMALETSYIWVTQRGKLCFNIYSYKLNEYHYYKKWRFKFEIYYEMKNNLWVSLTLVNKFKKIIKVLNTHGQQEINNWTMTREIIRCTVKGSAENDLYIKPNKLIRSDELRSMTIILHIKINVLYFYMTIM